MSIPGTRRSLGRGACAIITFFVNVHGIFCISWHLMDFLGLAYIALPPWGTAQAISRACMARPEKRRWNHHGFPSAFSAPRLRPKAPSRVDPWASVGTSMTLCS